MKQGLKYALAAGVFLLFYLGTGAFMARGIKNNNPGNIRKNGTKWQGLAPVQDDPDFLKFSEPIYGIRALARTLLTYNTRFGLNTVTGLISRWAPPSENDTADYIKAVWKFTGILPNTIIDVPTNLEAITKAIIRQENGKQPYSDTLIALAIQSAKQGVV